MNTSRTPYHGLALAGNWALASACIAAAALTHPGPMPGRIVLIWGAPAIYALTAAVSWELADLLEDFQRQLGLREKFAFFLAHVALLFSHVPAVGRFYLVWAMAALFVPLLLFLQREVNFNRLALAAGLTWWARLVRRPDEGPWLTLAFMALMIVAFLSSHHFLMYRRYGVTKGEKPGFFWRVAGLWIAAMTAGGLVIWLLLPRLEPVADRAAASASTLRPPSPPAGPPPVDLNFLLEALLWTSLIFGLLYGIYWIRAKWGGRRGVPFEAARTTLERVKDSVERRVLHPWRANLMNPADQVIFYYNLFCESMGRFNLGRRPAMTPVEYEAFLRERSGDVIRERGEDLNFITTVFQRALYAGGEVSSVESRHFHRLTGQIIKAYEQLKAGPQRPETQN
ncbi:MAG: hypothetical protein Kow0059_07530 [Candidatus Sumerlaeia bacterium]